MNKMIFYTVCVISVAAFGLADKITLPVTICKQSSPDYLTCLKNAIQEAWPQFVKGLPEFDFPPLEPLFYEGKFVLGSSGICAETSVANVTITGLSKIRFDAVKPYFNNDGFCLQVDMFKERVTFLGTYNIKITLGAIKLQQKGSFKVIETNTSETWLIKGRVTNDTFLIEYFDTLVLDGRWMWQMTGYSPIIMNIINKFVSDNFLDLFRVINLSFNDAVSPFLVDLSNRFMSKVPFSVLFSEN